MAVAKKSKLPKVIPPKPTISLVVPSRDEIAALATDKPRRILGSKWSMLSEAKNPEHFKQLVAQEVGDLSKHRLLSGRVLVATYVSGRTYKVGTLELHRTDKDVKEDLWQGTVGLVIKKGERAFADDETVKFHGQNVSVGEWVTYRPGDAKRIQIHGVDCRIIEDVVIDMVVPDPTVITHFQST